MTQNTNCKEWGDILKTQDTHEVKAIKSEQMQAINSQHDDEAPGSSMREGTF